MSTHFDLQPAIAACRAASAASQVSLVQLIARQGKAKTMMRFIPPQGLAATFLRRL
jgi:hypothetical protein